MTRLNGYGESDCKLTSTPNVLTPLTSNVSIGKLYVLEPHDLPQYL